MCFAPKICDERLLRKESISVALHYNKKTDIAVLERMLCSVKTVLILLAGY